MKRFLESIWIDLFRASGFWWCRHDDDDEEFSLLSSIVPRPAANLHQLTLRRCLFITKPPHYGWSGNDDAKVNLIKILWSQIFRGRDGLVIKHNKLFCCCHRSSNTYPDDFYICSGGWRWLSRRRWGNEKKLFSALDGNFILDFHYPCSLCRLSQTHRVEHVSWVVLQPGKESTRCVNFFLLLLRKANCWISTWHARAPLKSRGSALSVIGLRKYNMLQLIFRCRFDRTEKRL